MNRPFTFTSLSIENLILISPFQCEDVRGSIIKYYEKEIFREKGIIFEPYEEMQSVSQKGVIRGMHFQIQNWQDKLVRVVKGRVYDVVVDMRKDSVSFGNWVGIELSGENKNMLYIPKGFAHGFISLEEDTIFCYSCGDKYNPEADGGFCWNDTQINIDWYKYCNFNPIVSEKDKNLPTFQEVKEQLFV